VIFSDNSTAGGDEPFFLTADTVVLVAVSLMMRLVLDLNSPTRYSSSQLFNLTDSLCKKFFHPGTQKDNFLSISPFRANPRARPMVAPLSFLGLAGCRPSAKR
jgi:hypothetical protein